MALYLAGLPSASSHPSTKSTRLPGSWWPGFLNEGTGSWEKRAPGRAGGREPEG